jgi:hypothetical protein
VTDHVPSNLASSAEGSASLQARRRRLVARLAAERGELLWQLLGLDDGSLTRPPIFADSDWTVKDLLAHVAAWDRWEHRAMAALVAGEAPDFAVVEDTDAFNARAVDAWRDRTLAEVLTELYGARAAWVAWLRDVPLEEFFRPRELQGWDWAFPNCLEIQWQHDAEHAAQLAAWREEKAAASETGPKAVLIAALNAARDELLTSIALVRPSQRTSHAVCGHWTLKDLVGHVADWEQVGVEGLRDMAAGRPPDIAFIPDIDAWNRKHAAAREDQAWETCWEDLRKTREQLLDVLGEMGQAKLEKSYIFPWGPRGTAYEWVRVFAAHDREHAQGLREVTGAETASSREG